MLKSSTIAACVLALSGSVALAQTYPAQQGPATSAQQGSTMAPGTAAAPAATTQTQQGITTYSQGGQTMSGTGTLDYGAQGPGMQSQASAPADVDNGRAVAITDEYGNQYNSRGDRIGRGRPATQQQMR